MLLCHTDLCSHCNILSQMWWQEARRPLGKTCVGNESVPKIVISDTVYLLLKTAISILVISNHNSFRALFDKIFALEMASRGNQHYASCIDTFRSMF